MKKSFYSILAVLSVFAMLAAGCSTDADDGPTGDPPGQGTGTEVTLQSVTANGSATVNTSQLTLTFDKAITGLAAADITLSGVTGVTKGALAAGTTAGTYTLAITTTAAGTLSVAVAKTGYAVSGSPRTVAIHFASGGGPVGPTEDAFDQAVGLKTLVVTSGGPITVDTATGIISRPINDGYGNYFSVDLPSDIRPIAANDTIVITYIGRGGSALLTTKRTFGDTPDGDLRNPANGTAAQADYATWTGNLTQQTKSLTALQYGDMIPSTALYFQGRPNTTNAWELKIISITKTTGALIKVTAPAAIKPVIGETPVTEIDTLQYTGAVTWAPVDDTFGNKSYTATIVLTRKPGYTFNGIEADAFPVTGADTVTNAAGGEGETLSLTAAFPAATAAAPAINVTVASADDIIHGSGVTVALVSDGYKVTQDSNTGYGGAIAWVEVEFTGEAAAFDLTSYAKIKFDFTMSGSPAADGGWKNPRVFAALGTDDGDGGVTLPTGVSDNPAADAAYAKLGQGAQTAAAGVTSNQDVAITVPASFAGKKTVYIGFVPWASESAEFTVANISLHN